MWSSLRFSPWPAERRPCRAGLTPAPEAALQTRGPLVGNSAPLAFCAHSPTSAAGPCEGQGGRSPSGLPGPAQHAAHCPPWACFSSGNSHKTAILKDYWEEEHGVMRKIPVPAQSNPPQNFGDC